MGEYRDFLRYALISFFALAAMIVFWNILVTYLGDVAIVLYRYEGILILAMFLFVGFLSALALHLEPKQFLLYPIRWIHFRLKRIEKE